MAVPVARPSQNTPPMQNKPKGASEQFGPKKPPDRFGTDAAYVAVGGLRLPTVWGVAPVTATTPMLMAATPAVKPLSGTWQVAHDWRAGTEISSEKTFLPSASSAATLGAAEAVPALSAAALAITKLEIFSCMRPRVGS